MKTKQILYLCITGLIIAMIILSILPIWTFTNYPTASAATEEEVNTDYNIKSENIETQNGIFNAGYNNEISFTIQKNFTNSITLNLNIYTQTNFSNSIRIIAYDGETTHEIQTISNSTFINKNGTNIYINYSETITLSKEIKSILLNISNYNQNNNIANILLGEFTVNDGTTTYGYYNLVAKNINNSLYENAYNDGYNEAIDKEYQPVQLYEWKDLNYSLIYGYQDTLVNRVFKSEIWGNDPQYEGPTDTNIKNSAILATNPENIGIIEGQEFFLKYENAQNIAAIDIGYIYNTSSSGSLETSKWRSIKYWNITQENVLFTWQITPGDVVLNVLGASFYIRFIPINTQQPLQISNISLWTSNANYQAYEKGYNQGYNEGYNKGTGESISSATGFDIITIGFKGVFDALDVDIFYGKVSLVDIFNIFFIIMVVTAVLSIIRG